MLGLRKTVALAGVLGGVALAGTGVAHALVDDAPPRCEQDAQGYVVCTQTTERTWTSDDGTMHVRQKQVCSSVGKNRQYGPDKAAEPDARQGATLSCSVEGPH